MKCLERFLTWRSGEPVGRVFTTTGEGASEVI
jgi:hypothetical protein